MVADPAGLLAVARSLLTATPPSEAHFRRAVSTAYCAVFHATLRSGAERLMGPGTQRSAGYGLLYRGCNHGRMKTVCEALDVPVLGRRLQEQLGRTAVSPAMRDVAQAFPILQEARHKADYDPSVVFVLSDAIDLVDLAAATIQAFDQVAPEEKADMLALMLVSPRP